MHRTRTKICGITRAEDAQLAEQLGVDALGFVFVPASKRFITPEAALAISGQLAPFVTRVGLFLNAGTADVEQALSVMPQLTLQFHGTETPAQCEQFGVPYIKAIAAGGAMPGRETLSEYENASAFLFDSNEPGALGGTGHTFDWDALSNDATGRLVLAGGLSPGNVATGIKKLRPYAVDVSSGVEISKGIKDAAAMRAFMQAVAGADSTADPALSS